MVQCDIHRVKPPRIILCVFRAIQVKKNRARCCKGVGNRIPLDNSNGFREMRNRSRSVGVCWRARTWCRRSQHQAVLGVRTYLCCCMINKIVADITFKLVSLRHWHDRGNISVVYSDCDVFNRHIDYIKKGKTLIDNENSLSESIQNTITTH